MVKYTNKAHSDRLFFAEFDFKGLNYIRQQKYYLSTYARVC